MKNLFFALVIACGAWTSQASYLLWQVTEETVKEDTFLSTLVAKDPTATYYSQIRYGNGTSKAELDNYTAYADADGDAVLGYVGAPASTTDPTKGPVLIDLGVIASDPASYSYYVEILKYDSANKTFESVARSEAQTYQTLKDGNYVGSTLDIPSMAAWTGIGYSAPEPTGGMLVMMGLAFLGLKRRRT